MNRLVRMAAGARLMLEGAEWTVEECRPQSGRVVLRGAGGQRRPVTIRALVNDPGFRPAPSEPPGRAADSASSAPPGPRSGRPLKDPPVRAATGRELRPSRARGASPR
jgi:hypothetical protein